MINLALAGRFLPQNFMAQNQTLEHYRASEERSTGEYSIASLPEGAASALSKLHDEAYAWLPRLSKTLSDTAERAAITVADGMKAAIESKPDKTEWTVVFDLTTNFHNGYGVTARLKELRELAKQTEGKPITFVVQAAMPIGGDPTDPEFFSGDYDYNIDRYIIKDGKMKHVETVPSEGFGEDLIGLLTLTSKRFDPKKLALVVDSHGSGNQGLQGDAPWDIFSPGPNAGELKVDDLVHCIKRGLKDSGRTQVDLLDFDCCLMGQSGVMQRIQKVAHHVIASPETENIIGQSLRKPLEKLIADTGLNPEQLAGEILEAAKHQEVRDSKAWHNWLWKKPVPVETLSHYDVKYATQYDARLNKFGDLLTAALKDRKSAEALERILDETFTYGGKRKQISVFGVFLAQESHGKKFDVKDFTQRVVAAINRKEIADPDGKLRQSATETLESHDKLVRAYFGYGLYEKRGGLTVFLPGRQLRDPEVAAKSKTSAFQLQTLSAGLEHDKPDLKEKFQQLERKLKEISGQIESAEKKADSKSKVIEQVELRCRRVEKTFEKLQKASAEDFPKQLVHFNRATENLARTAFFQDALNKAKEEAREERNTVYKAELVNADTGWGRFRKALLKK